MARSQPITPWAYLRRARLRAGYTPTTAAQALNVTLSHYCSVEAGDRGFSDAVLIKTANLFNVDIEELDRTKPPLPRRGRIAEDETAVAS
jgi:transcriptional regulator with XRE-family HTH domain